MSRTLPARLTRLTPPAGSRNLVEVLESRRLFSAGALDISFSDDGKATINLRSDPTVSYTLSSADVAVQGDGKAVIVGTALPKDGLGPRDFGVARFNLDGTLDQTFGSGGVVTLHVGRPDAPREDAHAVAVYGDGRILVAGTTNVPGSGSSETQFAVARLLPSGALDPSFDDNGLKTIPFDESEQVNDVAIKVDGTIVLAGSTFATQFGSRNIAVALLNADGSLRRKTDIGFGGDEVANAVTIGAGGTIILAGSADFHGGSFSIVRLLASGDFDTTFAGSGGRLLQPFGLTELAGTDVLEQSDGKIVIVGSGVDDTTRVSVMTRLRSDGELDFTFGGHLTGVVETPGLIAQRAVIRSAEGGLIVGGGTDRFVVSGYTADGLLDLTFGFGGRRFTEIGDGTSGVRALARGPGRRFVATGGELSATARYLDAGANVVHATTFLDPHAAEAGRDPATFFVFREERLPFPTRVFFSVSGSAKFSNPLGLPDYTLSGLALTGRGSPFTPYVDIPANETIATVTLTPVDDTVVESQETAIFTILGSANYEIGAPSAATLTIADNDTIFGSTKVGTFVLSPSAAVLPSNGKLTYDLTWTHPGVWRDLSTIELRIVNDFGVLAWVRWDEATNLFSLYDAETGRYGAGALPGSKKKLRAGDVELDLRNTTAVGTGPTGPSVKLTLALNLKLPLKSHSRQNYRVEVFASDDEGNKQGFEPAGALRSGKK